MEDLLAIFFQSEDFFAIEPCSKEFLRFIIEEYIVLNHPGDCKASKEELSKYFSEITRKELDLLSKKYDELVIFNRTRNFFIIAMVAVVALSALGLATGEIPLPGEDQNPWETLRLALEEAREEEAIRQINAKYDNLIWEATHPELIDAIDDYARVNRGPR